MNNGLLNCTLVGETTTWVMEKVTTDMALKECPNVSYLMTTLYHRDGYSGEFNC
jgi:hypothetical protein